MGKPQRIDFYDTDDLFEKLKKRYQGVGFDTSFDNISRRYYEKAMGTDGATEEETIEGLVDSILETACPFTPQQMTAMIRQGWPEYRQPDAGQLQENQKLHETAARTFVRTNFERLNNKEVEKITDRHAKELYLCMSELGILDVTAEQMEKAYQERNSNDDYSNLILKTHKTFFTKERMDFYTKPRTDAEIVRDWHELNQICRYVSESQNLLKDMRKGVISEEEHARLSLEGGMFMQYDTYYTTLMATIVSPLYRVVDNGQLRAASPETLEKVNRSLNQASEKMFAADELKLGRGYLSMATIEIYTSGLSVLFRERLRDTIINTVMDPMQLLKQGETESVFFSTYDLLQQDGEKLTDMQAASNRLLATDEVLFVKHKETGETTPVVLMSRDRDAVSYAVGEQIPMSKIDELANPSRPTAPGFFSRLFSSIKELFTGTPTETVRRYNEDLAKYERNVQTQEVFRQIKQTREERVATRKETAPAQAREAEKVSEIDGMLMSKMQAACETMADFDRFTERPELKTALGTLLTCASLAEAKQSVTEKEFEALRSQLMNSEKFQMMAEKVGAMSEMVANTYKMDDLGSCLKATRQMVGEFDRISAQPQKTAAVPQPQKSTVKGGPER